MGVSHDRRWLEEVWLPPILDLYREYLKLGMPFDEAFARKLGSCERMVIADLPQAQIIVGSPEECIAGLELRIADVQPDSIIVDFGQSARGGLHAGAQADLTVRPRGYPRVRLISPTHKVQ